MTQQFKRICVYCGSREGRRHVYAEAARRMGRALAERGIGLVYGGGRVGMMRLIADAVLADGGRVYGVIPEKLLQLELGHTEITELFIVNDMHTRKAMMASLADAFIAMPGGFGTLEEIIEMTTWTQLNYHLKPVGLLNVQGYFDPLLRFIEHAANEGFIRPHHRNLLLSADTPTDLLDSLLTVEIPRLEEWVGSAEPD